MLTYWILSPYLKNQTTPEVCIPQIEHATYRRGGTHNCHTLVHWPPVDNGYYRLTHTHSNWYTVSHHTRKHTCTQPQDHLHQHGSHSWRYWQWMMQLISRVASLKSGGGCEKDKMLTQQEKASWLPSCSPSVEWSVDGVHELRVSLHIAQCKHSHVTCD